MKRIWRRRRRKGRGRWGEFIKQTIYILVLNFGFGPFGGVKEKEKTRRVPYWNFNKNFDLNLILWLHMAPSWHLITWPYLLYKTKSANKLKGKGLKINLFHTKYLNFTFIMFWIIYTNVVSNVSYLLSIYLSHFNLTWFFVLDMIVNTN